MARRDYEKVSGGADNDEEEQASQNNSDIEDDFRTSQEVRRHDAETIEAEEEAERLLAGGSAEKAVSSQRRERRKKSRRRDGREKEERELVYDVEQGGPRSSSAESSGHSSEVDLVRLGKAQAKRKKSKRRRVCGLAAIHVVIVAAFLALLYGAWRATRSGRHGGQSHAGGTPDADKAETPGALTTTYEAQLLSNGTHRFAPTTILISLDGFRADFLQRHISPTLTDFIHQGVSPKYMLPSFPSLTFPNHFTLVTGLYPESHGIVGNTFWDPELQREFYYTDPARSMQAEWWTAEPIWVTAEKSGVRTGVHMWPGSEVRGGIEGVEASFVDKYNGEEHLDNKVKRILGWLDLPSPLDDHDLKAQDGMRPQLIAAYVPNVDADGHKYGPNSTYIRSTIAEVDGMLGSLFRGIEERNLTEVVNIVIVSDHGMATTSSYRLIQLEDLIDTSLIEHTDGWPLYGLRPRDQSPAQLKKLYDLLTAESKLGEHKHKFDVYLRDEDMPKRYHFAKNNRIAPLWIVPQAGWAIVTKDEYDVANGLRDGKVYEPRGLHGYDNQHALMRAIFVARGPAFPHTPGSEVEPFQNTEVYNIICDSLGIKPVPNNGTLRLPLKTVGVHDTNQPLDVPEDPQDDPSLALPPEVPNLASWHDSFTAATSLPPEVANLANRPDFMVPTAGVPPVAAPTDEITKPEQIGRPNQPVDAPTRPVVHDGVAEEEQEGDVNRWWDWVSGKLDAIKGWANGLWGGEGKGGAEDETAAG
jgi:predicted AlkP superfamily pyrophosphatase or phosphodiesterase